MQSKAMRIEATPSARGWTWRGEPARSPIGCSDWRVAQRTTYSQHTWHGSHGLHDSDGLGVCPPLLDSGTTIMPHTGSCLAAPVVDSGSAILTTGTLGRADAAESAARCSTRRGRRSGSIGSDRARLINYRRQRRAKTDISEVAQKTNGRNLSNKYNCLPTNTNTIEAAIHSIKITRLWSQAKELAPLALLTPWSSVFWSSV